MFRKKKTIATVVLSAFALSACGEEDLTSLTNEEVTNRIKAVVAECNESPIGSAERSACLTEVSESALYQEQVNRTGLDPLRRAPISNYEFEPVTNHFNALAP